MLEIQVLVTINLSTTIFLLPELIALEKPIRRLILNDLSFHDAPTAPQLGLLACVVLHVVQADLLAEIEVLEEDEAADTLVGHEFTVGVVRREGGAEVVAKSVEELELEEIEELLVEVTEFEVKDDSWVRFELVLRLNLFLTFLSLQKLI